MYASWPCSKITFDTLTSSTTTTTFSFSIILLHTDAEELHVSNVTSSSLKLRWSRPDAKLFVYFEVAVVRLHDHALVLKTNVSGTELAVDNLESAQMYQAAVTAYTAEGQIVSTLKGVVTTSEFIKTALAFSEIFRNTYFACVAYSSVNMPLGYRSTQAQV